MALYKLGETALTHVAQPPMANLKIRERQDLQRLLKNQIDVISPGTLVISEEYSGWSGSLRRIDLLGIDPDGTLVVFELKRTEDGGHMDLQGIRYAAMASVLSYEEVLQVFANYLAKSGSSDDAEDVMRKHLETENNEDVAGRVRIVLVSADFGTEITTTVLWLNEQSLDIRCVRLVPYQDGDFMYLDVQQIIPVPEASDYTIKIREKATQRKAAGRRAVRDLTKYRVTVGTDVHSGLGKGRAILAVVKGLHKRGISPGELRTTINQGMKRFYSVPGSIKTEAEFVEAANNASLDNEGREFDSRRYFTGDEDLLHDGGRTYAFSTQWGPHTEQKMRDLVAGHRNGSVSFEREEP